MFVRNTVPWGRAPAILLGLLAGAAPTAQAAPGPLTLAEAEALALARDAGLEELQARRESLLEGAVAEAELPDPELTLGANNVPVDSFSLSQEPMTMLVVGVRQRFPGGDSRQLSRARMEILAEANLAGQEMRRRRVVQALRTAWLESAWHEAALELVEAQARWYQELREAVTAAYAAGRRRQDELIRIGLEREALVAEQIRLGESRAPWQAGLERWLGEDAARVPADTLPDIPAPATLSAARAALERHPLIAALEDEVAAEGLGVDLARQAYKPDWMVELGYGLRSGEEPDGDSRSNMVTAMLSFDLPLFTGDRQDRRVSAARADERAARRRVEDQRRELTAALEAAWARRQRLAERIALFETEILPASADYVDATRFAYQNDLAPFDELVRAEQSLLESRLDRLRLEADRRIAEVELDYLAGTTPGETP
jgi:outer membrane protein TolC